MASNVWCRLWHDMPTDPKFRVIAKASGQPLHLVIALYTCLMVDASRNEKSRGVTTCHDEDLAVTLDCDMSQIAEIKSAMQGRVLDGNELTGWHKRQVKKEDSGNSETGAKSAAERQAAKRERERLASENVAVTTCHDESRNVTLDKDKDKELKPLRSADASPTKTGTRLPDDWALPKPWGEWAMQNKAGVTADDVRLMADSFADYWQAKPGKDARKLDWQKAWRNWVRNTNTAKLGSDTKRHDPFKGAL